MKYLPTFYFLLSGIFMCWTGLSVTRVTPHLGQPIGSMLTQEIMEAAATSDTKKKEALSEGLRRFDAHLDRVVTENFRGAATLALFGLFHIGMGVILAARRKPIQSATDQRP